MSDKLKPVEEQIRALEASVIKAYRECVDKGTEADEKFVRFPDDIKQRIASEAKAVETALYSTGDITNLSLVSDRHDELRIRTIFIQHLLERDIPIPYVRQALTEFKKQPDSKVTASGNPIGAHAPDKYRDEEKQGLIGRFLSFLFGGGKPKTKTVPVQRPRPVAKTPELPMPEDELRVILLHKLMEEDSHHLLSDQQRVRDLPRDIHIPSFIANFQTKEYAGTYIANRVRRKKEGTKENESIARTPEELRAKLARRTGTVN